MAKKRRIAKGFFALDVEQFARIGTNDLGVEEAATYLALMKGTDQSNTVSVGGINSVINYTGLTKSEAKKAVKNLARIGLVDALDVERIRARTAPRHKLPIRDTRRRLAAKEQAVVGAIEAGQQPEGQSEINAANRAADKGWLERLHGGWAVIEHANKVAFIPNQFVHIEGKVSPLARLVTTGEVEAIMLAAELYELQNLMDERGVPREILRGYFRSEYDHRAGMYRAHMLFAGRTYTDGDGESRSFDRAHSHRWRSPGDLWSNLRILDANHVIEWSIYSANGKPRGADETAFNRPQRPLGVLRNGRQVLNTPESRPAFMSFVFSLLAEEGGGLAQLHRPLDDLIGYWRERSPVVAVENTSVAHVEGVSTLRMVHRAQTDNTTQWYRELCRDCDLSIFFLDGAIRENFPQASVFVENFRSATGPSNAISM